MLQCRDLIAQAVIGQGAEIVPPGRALAGVAQGADSLPVAAEADIVISRLLILVAGLFGGAAVLPVAAAKGAIPTEGIVVTAAIAAIRTAF